MNGEISILSPFFRKPSLRPPHKTIFQNTTTKRLSIEIYAVWQNLSLEEVTHIEEIVPIAPVGKKASRL
jgi:hypothetical protein